MRDINDIFIIEQFLDEMDLSLGKIIPAKNPKSAFRLIVDWMSGDCDANNLENYTFKLDDTEDLKVMIRALRLIKANNNSIGFDEMRVFFSENGFNNEEIKLIMNFWEKDVFCEYPAHPETITLSLFDEFGIERDIPFK